jgi:hypothetical protein
MTLGSLPSKMAGVVASVAAADQRGPQRIHVGAGGVIGRTGRESVQIVGLHRRKSSTVNVMVL